MIRYVASRLAWTLVTTWFVVTATFAMTMWLPADPAKSALGPHATPATLARFSEHYCLDRGALVQYGCYVGNIARGDLGESFRSKREVAEIIADHAWPTVQLALAAIALQLVIGVPLGVIAAVRRGRWPDRATGLVNVIAQSAPTFFVGTLLLYLGAYRLGWFPIGGYGEGVLDRLHHLVLPAATLATIGIAYYTRLVREAMIDALGEDYVRTARAKGVGERRVVLRHALRNALGPLVALVGLDLGVLLGGAVVTEAIFAWPGLGRELLQAVLEIDIPLILGVVVVSAIAIAVASLLVDLALLVLDPRLRDD
jgi:peptide/nickel transport system permease protein